MKKCVLIDFNNLLFRTLFASDVNIKSEMPSFSLWRYMVYDSIYQTIIYTRDVSEVILAVDDKNYWRRAYWSRYKEKRKEQREKTGINWDIIFGVVNKYIGDIKHHMPFKVIKIRSAEADDIIAILAMNLERKECIISSNDEDYLQLSSDRIKIWNPSKQEYLVCEDTDRFLLKKILIGQPKDGIFNIKTPTNWGLTSETEGKRKPGFGETTAEKMLSSMTFEEIYEWVEKNNLEDNYKRNEVLIDFRRIPHTVEKRTLDMYKKYSFPPPENMYPFFKKHDMKSFLDKFDNIERTLLKLYE